MRVGIITLFPPMFAALRDFGVSGRACDAGLLDLRFWNPRDFARDRHRTVDDRPYGGGSGMIMKPEPLLAAIAAARAGVGNGATAGEGQPPVIYLSPQGQPLSHALVAGLARREALILLCGRYQGIDARVIDEAVDEELSLGDFVLSGGELAAMALLDAVIRLRPGTLGAEDSALGDSFSDGLLHCPQYTRPQCYRGREVPPILLSGNHEAIARWQRQQSLGATWLKRPDLLADRQLEPEQEALLRRFQAEHAPSPARPLKEGANEPEGAGTPNKANR